MWRRTGRRSSRSTRAATPPTSRTRSACWSRRSPCCSSRSATSRAPKAISPKSSDEAPMALAIRVSDVSKRFNLHHDKSLKERLINLRRTDTVEPFWALQHVSFELEQSHTLGLIGANGSGKSTLLKLIGGILTPSDGYVERRGRIAALLELGSGFHPDLTGRENVYMNASILGLTRKQTDAYFDEIIEFSGIEQFIDNQVKFYSSGMY